LVSYTTAAKDQGQFGQEPGHPSKTPETRDGRFNHCDASAGLRPLEVLGTHNQPSRPRFYEVDSTDVCVRPKTDLICLKQSFLCPVPVHMLRRFLCLWFDVGLLDYPDGEVCDPFSNADYCVFLLEEEAGMFTIVFLLDPRLFSQPISRPRVWMISVPIEICARANTSKAELMHIAQAFMARLVGCKLSRSNAVITSSSPKTSLF